MTAVETFKKGLGALLRWACITLFALLLLVVVFQVVVRFTGGGAPWSEAIARYLFIWLGLIGAAYVIGENDDVAIDFLVRKFPPVVVKAVETLAHLIVAGFAFVILVQGGMTFVSRTWDQPVELLGGITTGQVYLALPISGVLIALYSLSHIIDVIAKPVVRKSDEDVDIATVVEEGI